MARKLSPSRENTPGPPLTALITTGHRTTGHPTYPSPASSACQEKSCRYNSKANTFWTGWSGRSSPWPFNCQFRKNGSFVVTFPHSRNFFVRPRRNGVQTEQCSDTMVVVIQTTKSSGARSQPRLQSVHQFPHHPGGVLWSCFGAAVHLKKISAVLAVA